MGKRSVARIFRISDNGDAHMHVAFGEGPIGSAVIRKETVEKMHLKEGDTVSLEFDKDWEAKNVRILHL